MEQGGSGAEPRSLSQFCSKLKRLQTASGIKQSSLSDAAHLSTSQMSDILNGKIKRLPSWDVTLRVVRACLKHGKEDGSVPPDLNNEEHWRAWYSYVDQDLEDGDRSKPHRVVPAGRLLANVTDPFALEVHRPIQQAEPRSDLPALPVYVPREHDTELAQVVEAGVQGTSGLTVLVGGSSTGKTRACWEALRLLRGQPKPWRLWHPIDPSRPEAALRELPSIGPRTIVWLNEAQFYLDVERDGLGEQIAAGLRELLRDPDRGPVLVLATLWPEFWSRLTARPPAGADDPHAHARELLAGRDISVPATFSPAQLLHLAAAVDLRLTLAAEAAEDGRVIQFLAGAPELLARYRNAPPTAAALITAAMDARRMGMGIVLPLAFLEAAAPGYLADTDWDALSEDWLEQALAYTAAPCKGIRGPLSRIRPRTTVTAYRLADYLEQHGRLARQRHMPPVEFWRAAAHFAAPSDLPALARAAEDRGLLRDAARLRKHAIAQGNTIEAGALVEQWRLQYPYAANPNLPRWVAAHAALDNPEAVAGLLRALREAGAAEQVAALLTRDPAANAPLDNPEAVARLLDALREVGAREQAAALADRATAHAALDNPEGVAGLLHALRRVGASEEVATLLARDPAACAALDDPEGIAGLLHVLRLADAAEQAAALADRVASHAAVDDPAVVVMLLNVLLLEDAAEQAAVLASRAAAHAPLDDPDAVVGMLRALREAGADEQAAALASRAAEHASVDYPEEVALLLGVLHEVEAAEQAAVLASRAASHAAVDDPAAVAGMLRALREAGAAEQAAALASRAAAHVSVDYPEEVALLLLTLHEAGAEEQVTALLARDPATHAPLDYPEEVAWLLYVLREVGADEQVTVLLARDPAVYVALDYPEGVALLLDALREVGAEEQVTALLARDPATHTPLDDREGFAELLDALRRAEADEQAAALVDRTVLAIPYAFSLRLVALHCGGAQEQAAALASRVAAHAAVDNPRVVAGVLEDLLSAGAQEQAAALASRAAAHAAVDNLSDVADLVRALPKAGAQEHAAALISRAAADAALDHPGGVAYLLRALREVGAEEQVTALLARDPAAHAALDHPGTVALLEALREAGAEEQARKLVDRLPAEGRFNLFREQAGHTCRYQFGREPNGSPALPWDWDDLD